MSIFKIRNLRVFVLRLIPLVDVDRDHVPNKYPGLSRKCFLGPTGFNQLAIARNIFFRPCLITEVWLDPEGYKRRNKS